MQLRRGEEVFLAEWSLPLWPPPEEGTPLVRKLVVMQQDDHWIEFGYSLQEYACAKRSDKLDGVGMTPEEAVDGLIQERIKSVMADMRHVEAYLARTKAYIESLNSLDRSAYQDVTRISRKSRL